MSVYRQGVFNFVNELISCADIRSINFLSFVATLSGKNSSHCWLTSTWRSIEHEDFPIVFAKFFIYRLKILLEFWSCGEKSSLWFASFRELWWLQTHFWSIWENYIIPTFEPSHDLSVCHFISQQIKELLRCVFVYPEFTVVYHTTVLLSRIFFVNFAFNPLFCPLFFRF